jgi:hypothetical protein
MTKEALMERDIDDDMSLGGAAMAGYEGFMMQHTSIPAKEVMNMAGTNHTATEVTTGAAPDYDRTIVTGDSD